MCPYRDVTDGYNSCRGYFFSFRVPTCILYYFLIIFFILQSFSYGMPFLYNIYLDNYIQCIFPLYVCIGKRCLWIQFANSFAMSSDTNVFTYFEYIHFCEVKWNFQSHITTLICTFEKQLLIYICSLIKTIFFHKVSGTI